MKGGGGVKVSGRWGEDRKKSQGNGRTEKERKGQVAQAAFTSSFQSGTEIFD